MLTPVLLAQASPTDINLFRQIDSVLQEAFAAFLNPAVSNIIGMLQTTALLGGTLYILLVGLTIVLGADSTPFYSFLKTSGKIVLVSAFSLSADGYLGGLVEALKGLETGLVQALHLDLGGSLSSPGSVVEQLDQMLSVGFDKFAQCLQQANTQGVFSPGAALAWALAGLIFGMATAALAIFGGATVLLTKFALTILFALGPLFVFGLMFPQTSSFFDKWLGEVLSFILQNVIVSVVLSFAMMLFMSFITRAELQTEDATNPFIAAMQVFVVAFVMVYFLWKSGPMATGLSGGMGASVVDAVSAAGMSSAIGASSASGAKKAAAVPKQVVAGAKKVGSGVSKAARHLAHFGKPQKLQAAGSDKPSGSESAPSSSAAKTAAATTNTTPPPAPISARAAKQQERKAAKLGAKALRAKAIGSFAAGAAPQQRSVTVVEQHAGKTPNQSSDSPKTSKAAEPMKNAPAPQPSNNKETKNDKQTKR